jgi:hypothetical protein
LVEWVVQQELGFHELVNHGPQETFAVEEELIVCFEAFVSERVVLDCWVQEDQAPLSSIYLVDSRAVALELVVPILGRSHP